MARVFQVLEKAVDSVVHPAPITRFIGSAFFQNLISRVQSFFTPQAITVANAGSDTFTIAGDFTVPGPNQIKVGDTFVVAGSTGNDGEYSAQIF